MSLRLLGYIRNSWGAMRMVRTQGGLERWGKKVAVAENCTACKEYHKFEISFGHQGPISLVTECEEIKPADNRAESFVVTIESGYT